MPMIPVEVLDSLQHEADDRARDAYQRGRESVLALVRALRAEIAEAESAERLLMLDEYDGVEHSTLRHVLARVDNLLARSAPPPADEEPR